jgi:hypothetical protein
MLTMPSTGMTLLSFMRKSAVARRDTIADGLYTLLFSNKTGIHASAREVKKTEFQLAFSFWDECG